MKNLMITTALVASLISLGYAQGRTERTRHVGVRTERPDGVRQARTPEQHAQMATDALEKKLSLSAEQKAKVYTLKLERAEKMDKSMKSQREFRETQMKKKNSIMEDSEKELSKILNTEQQKSYDEMKKLSQERMKGRRSQGPRGRVR
ncbi:hypothetical protein [Daejeonella sp.]|uniref:hypothetical protein n=1 Tax=Daejeonella sp. TaxID=2805397 RepID=UPI003983013C